MRRSNFIVEFGHSVARVRGSKGFTQEVISNLVFLSGSTLSNLENGMTDPKLSTIERIASAIGVHPSEFFLESKNIHLEYPLPLQELNDILRYEPNYVIEAILKQTKAFLEMKNYKK